MEKARFFIEVMRKQLAKSNIRKVRVMYVMIIYEEVNFYNLVSAQDTPRALIYIHMNSELKTLDTE